MGQRRFKAHFPFHTPGKYHYVNWTAPGQFGARPGPFPGRPLGLPEVTVVRTAWHPKPERRSAKVRIVETDELVTVREGDEVAGLVLQEITPSAVVFSAGDVEIRRRVGEASARR